MLWIFEYRPGEPDRRFLCWSCSFFLPFNKRKHQAPAVVQGEQRALSAVSAARPGSNEGYRARWAVPVGPRPAGGGE